MNKKLYAVSQDAENILQQIAQEIGTSKGNVLSSAISLLALARAIKNSNNQLCILDSEGTPIQSVISMSGIY